MTRPNPYRDARTLSRRNQDGAGWFDIAFVVALVLAIGAYASIAFPPTPPTTTEERNR
jgi:hypothetical protein